MTKDRKQEIWVDFENWLMEYHADQNPEILDDMLPDCFNDWVADLDADTWIELGNKYANEIAERIGNTDSDYELILIKDLLRIVEEIPQNLRIHHIEFLKEAKAHINRSTALAEAGIIKVAEK